MTIEKLSVAEQQILKQRLYDFGAKKDCSGKTGIHYTTLNRVLRTGITTSAIADKLRTYINIKRSRVFIDFAA